MSGAPPERDDGYRRTPRGGPAVRTDIVDVYIFRVRRAGDPSSVEFLQLLRSGAPLANTWHPVMGHVEAGETALRCALRELDEEVALAPGGPGWVAMWALEQVHPFYLPELDTIVMSPRFAVEVRPDWSPALSAEHSDARWTDRAAIPRMFMWPGQKRACEEVLDEIVRSRPGAPARRPLDVA